MKLLQNILAILILIFVLDLGYAQTGSSKKIKKIDAKIGLEKSPVFFPLPSKGFKRISSGFGTRRHPILKKNKFHFGLDLAAKKGTPIYASAQGKVVTSKYSSTYGNFVVINHQNGYKTLYAHMIMAAVKKNQRVKQGAVIGYVGSTGRSTGPHLHYEILRKNKKINPLKYWLNTLKVMKQKRVAFNSKKITK